MRLRHVCRGETKTGAKDGKAEEGRNTPLRTQDVWERCAGEEDGKRVCPGKRAIGCDAEEHDQRESHSDKRNTEDRSAFTDNPTPFILAERQRSLSLAVAASL